MGLLTSYNANNFVLIDDYNYRCNQIDCGQPIATVEVLSGTTTHVTIDQWWRAMVDEQASFKYVGMSYDAAQRCAADLRNAFTINKYPWAFGAYLSSISGENVLLYGWYKGTSTPVCESEIRVEHHSIGSMYDVVVNARCTTENYDKGANALDLNQKPLLGVVGNLPGWNDTHQLSGKYFDQASISNIYVITAPTQTVSFELVAERLQTTNKDNLSSFDLSNWYRATTDSYAQVKYDGMTKSACRNLYSSLNSTNGWYLSSHPWVYKWQDNKLGWHQDTDVTQYQCLNTFKANEDESGMFTAELTLHAQDITMTNNPTGFTPPNWPSIWTSKIPGLSSYL